MSWIEHVIRAIGTKGLDIQVQPFPVTVVPDDYPPPIRNEGILSAGVAAGGVGIRSEILLIAVGAKTTGALIEIGDIWVSCNVASNVEVVSVKSALGFADVPNNSTDLRAGSARLKVQVKNSAAATVADKILTSSLRAATSEVYIGPFPLRALLEVGGLQGTNAIIVRPTADNVQIRLVASYRELMLRKL